jgi:glutamate racemase
MSARAAVADPRPVLVFDSGLGGLSVLKAIQALLPEQPTVYLADDAGFPYGERGDDHLVDRIMALIGEAVAAHDPAAVVIACNTASTLVLPPLRARFAVPFVGTVPAIKPAAAQTQTGIVAVLATPGTMKRDYTRDLIAQFAGRCDVCLVGAPDLAALAERHLAGEAVDMDALAEQIGPCFVTQGSGRTDIVVLACTHYPFLTDQMTTAAPWPVTWLDPAPAIARQVARVLATTPQAPAGAPSAQSHQDRENVVIFTSGRPPSPAILRLLQEFRLQTETATQAV